MKKKRIWENLFKEYEESGLSRKQFCKRSSISYNQFHYYWKKMNEKTMALPLGIEGKPQAGFERIRIKPEPGKLETVHSTLPLIIHFPNQIRCEIQGGFLRDNLSDLLAELMQLC